MDEDNKIAKAEEWETWGIVELMGHQRIAGRLSEQEFGGKMLRVDVPATNGNQGYAKLCGPSSIYGVTFTDKETAIKMIELCNTLPFESWDLKREIHIEAERIAAARGSRPEIEQNEDGEDGEELGF